MLWINVLVENSLTIAMMISMMRRFMVHMARLSVVDAFMYNFFIRVVLVLGRMVRITLTRIIM